MSSYDERKQIRSAFRDLMKEIDAQYFLTLTFNQDIADPVAYGRLKEFFQRLDRQMLGPRYVKYPQRRALFIASFEHPGRNSHYHCVGRFDPETKWRDRELDQMCSQVWRKLWRKGTTNLQPIYDRDGAVSYTTKDLFREGNYDRLIVSSQFWPN